MSDHGISAVPIVGVDGLAVGVVSSTDVRTITRHCDVYPSLFRSLREFLMSKVRLAGCMMDGWVVGEAFFDV